MWYIYKHTFPNGKVYIGLSKQKENLRFKQGLGYEYCPVVWKAIQKYGWDSVVTEIIEDKIDSLEQAQLREQYWIKYYNSYVNSPNSNGYNATIGGEGSLIYDWNLIYLDWKSGLSSVELTSKYGICKDSITHILDTYNVSKEERKQHLSNVQSKQQRLFDREQIINLWNEGKTASFIQQQLGCSRDVVRRTLDEYCVSKKDRTQRAQEQLKKNPCGHNKKQVNQYDLKGNFIKTFDSIKQANLVVNLAEQSTNIIDVCKGRRKTAGGYIWKYTE